MCPSKTPVVPVVPVVAPQAVVPQVPVAEWVVWIRLRGCPSVVVRLWVGQVVRVERKV